jgi:hypothetical protein
VGGSPGDCNDGNPCTDDSCDAQAGCVNTDNLNPCDDGNACNGPDSCFGGVCALHGPPPACGCQLVYNIDAAHLDNQAFGCNTEHHFTNTSGPYGFHWDDDPSVAGVGRIDVELQSGVGCDGGSATVTLNRTPWDPSRATVRVPAPADGDDLVPDIDRHVCEGRDNLMKSHVRAKFRLQQRRTVRPALRG